MYAEIFRYSEHIIEYENERDAQIAQKHAQKEIKTGSIVVTSGTGIYWIFYLALFCYFTFTVVSSIIACY